LASTLGIVISSVVAMGLLLLAPDPRGFDENSCDRLKEGLTREVFGQTLATNQFVNAVCDHLWEERPLKPLVLSIHGPPGVGKSFSHFVAARALYNATSSSSECPGLNCEGYKVVYGLDYTIHDRDKQSEALVSKLIGHLSARREALVVIEEYDKLDCKSRGVLKQIFDKGLALNVTEQMQKSVFLLESNTGYGKIVESLNAARGRQEDVDAESLQYTLKNMMFNLWQSEKCEDRVDTVKSLSLIDMFVPYFPLDRQAIRQVLQRSIQRRVKALNKGRGKQHRITVSEEVLEFLCDKIEWDGAYAVEGAKEVATVIRRHVFGLLYKLSVSGDHGTNGGNGEGGGVAHLELAMDEAGKKVELREMGLADAPSEEE